MFPQKLVVFSWVVQDNMQGDLLLKQQEDWERIIPIWFSNSRLTDPKIHKKIFFFCFSSKKPLIFQELFVMILLLFWSCIQKKLWEKIRKWGYKNLLKLDNNNWECFLLFSFPFHSLQYWKKAQRWRITEKSFFQYSNSDLYNRYSLRILI